MKFYSKLALHFLCKKTKLLREAYKLISNPNNIPSQQDLNSSDDKSDNILRILIEMQNKLNKDLSYATYKFEEKLIALLRNDSQKSNDSIHNNLSDLIEKFKNDMSMIQKMHDTPWVDVVKKMVLLIKMIKDECTDASVWDLEYDDSDPACIFQYRMLTYIIADTASDENTLSNQNLQSIKEELGRIRESYFALPSKSAKIDFICSCLKNISNASHSNQNSTIALPVSVSFFQIFNPTLLKLVSNSPLEQLIKSIHREVSDLQPKEESMPAVAHHST